jgi:peptidoglycan/xylan/chitin deacetylase (PgdA/CDA1 family)
MSAGRDADDTATTTGSRSVTTRVAGAVRSSLSPARRARLRRLTDPWVGPLGSVRGAHTEGAVAVTFDDGPTDATEPILEVLERWNATATFFMLVDRAEARPATARAVVAAGHEVALHGLDHSRLTSMPAAALGRHFAEGKERLEQVIGRPVRRFRPPYGAQSPRTFLAARRRGLEVVVWTAEGDDWIEHEPADIAELAARRAQPGGVVLLHDGFASDAAAPLPAPQFDRAEALDLLLKALADRSLAGVSVERLLADARVHRTAWFRG